MATKVQRRNGGYFTVPNRWIDAGYMAAAPGSVTLVYLHLSRWADNGTLQAAQPMKLIAKKCGLSEDVARKAIRTLEAWGVLERDPESGRNAMNRWYLNDLPEQAPEYPDKVPPKQSGGPKKVGVQQSGGPYQPNSYQPEESDQPESGLRLVVPDQDSQPETEPRKRPTPAPSRISDKAIAWARSKNISDADIEREAEKFLNSATANGRRYLDWDAAWRTWITNAIAWGHVTPDPTDDDRELTQDELLAIDNFMDWVNAGHYEHGYEGMQRWRTDRANRTLPQIRRKP